MRYRKMRILCLSLIVTIFNANADVKGWFGELWDKGSSKLQSGIEDFKETDMGQSISNWVHKAENFAKNNESGTISPEVSKAHKNLLDLTIELKEGIKTGIETFTALKSEKYKDQIELYKKVEPELDTLKNHLSKKLDSLVNGKVMIRFAEKSINNIVEILKEDQGMLSLSQNLKESFEEFKNALEKLEKDLKTAK